MIVGGLTLGTLLTLFVVPTAYTLLGRHAHIEGVEKSEAGAAEVVPVPQPSHAD